MFCPKCGKINPDNEERCSGCGAELHAETEPITPAKKRNGLKIAFAIVAVLIIICILIFILSGCDMGGIPKDNISF